jgi:hypothetical protein
MTDFIERLRRLDGQFAGQATSELTATHELRGLGTRHSNPHLRDRSSAQFTRIPAAFRDYGCPRASNLAACGSYRRNDRL